MRNRLCCEVDFGKQSQAEDRLLQRSDAISGSLFSFISEPKNQSSHSLVTSSALLQTCIVLINTLQLHTHHVTVSLSLPCYGSIVLCLACLHQSSGVRTTSCQASCRCWLWRQIKAFERIREHVLRLQKERRSFGGLTNAITNALNITSSSSNQNLPVLKRQATHASCSGNWLSHFDWDGQRRALPFCCLCMLME